MLPYWLASRPIKGRASALSVLQSESYLLTDQLCNNHVQHSRTLLTLTGGHLDLWPAKSILLVVLLLILKMFKLKKLRSRGGQKMHKLVGKNDSCVWSVSEKARGLVFCRPRSLTDCSYSRLNSKFSFFAKSANYFNHKLFFLFVYFLYFVILKWRDRVLTHVPFRQTMIYHHWGFLSQARRVTACI